MVRPETHPPFLVRPRYVVKPWGGRRLETVLGRGDLPPGPVGESWEVGDFDEWTALIEGGPFDGRSLRAAWGAPFPLFVKVIDAREDLSVQVHPDGRDGSPAKEEAWAALADGGAVAVGTVEVGRLPRPGQWLGSLDVSALRAPQGSRPPSIVHVPPGTVHAILAGALVWEIQTPVNVTWRLDDHGRLGLDGRPRRLHLEEATAVLARGSEAVARLSVDGRALRGRRIALFSHPPGTWAGTPGCVAFFSRGGDLDWVGPDGGRGSLEVPPGRTVVLTPGVRCARSDGWMLAAGPA